MNLPYVAHGVDFDVTDDSFIPCDIIFRDLRGEYVPLSAALNRVTSYMGCYALTRGTTCPLPKDVSEKLSVVFHVSYFAAQAKGQLLTSVCSAVLRLQPMLEANCLGGSGSSPMRQLRGVQDRDRDEDIHGQCLPCL